MADGPAATGAPGAPEQPTLLGLDGVGAAGSSGGGRAARSAAGARGTGGARPRRRARARDVDVEPAADLPVARVAVELAPAHLDRPFEYLVPATLADTAAPGTRVKVRFGAQDVDGYVLGRAAEPEHDGALVPLRRVVSPEPVLTPAVGRLARAVADRYAGTLADVLRLAVPPRHARTEGEVPPAVAVVAPGDAAADGAARSGDAAAPGGAAGSDGAAAARAGAAAAPTTDAPAAGAAPASAWAPYRGGPAFLAHLAAGGSPRAAWSALPGPPGERWPDGVAEAARATLASGRGVLVVVPDARDVDRVCAALVAAGVPAWSPDGTDASHVRLMADDGPARRYRAFLAALRGHARVVVGTRAAAFAPVRDLGLAVCWDDGDDLHAEPRAPYPHVREVLGLRAELEGCGLLLAAHARSTEVQALVASGWVRAVAADRDVVRARTPRVRALTSVELAREGAAAAARLPGEAWRTIRDRLADGPVLVQVPRAGYLPAVACARCREIARCTHCHGPLALTSGDGTAQCRWCGRLAIQWRCEACGNGTFRSVAVGSDRTAEELGRAFPGVTVRHSGARSGVLAEVPDRPALVVSTIGAEPVAPAGYAAAVLLDAAVTTGSTSLRATEDAVRRWLAAAALVRSSRDGGVVLLVGDGAERPTQALVRWDPVGLAERELAERAEVRLPPVVRVAELVGTREVVAAVLARVELPEGSDVLGPVPQPEPLAPGGAAVQESLDPPVRTLVRVPAAHGRTLARSLAASLAVRSARREGGSVRVRLDPEEML
ncbi:primosomal protein N' [Cellulomonas sp. ACRRI]|uniref:primosomal protein N' n=1 Tax=Cellulomonas sp. ACRRI TaxID=2918188 RepID=UPI001EF35D3F|nr:primosomal protein N' [Cellulomonas sp. ACRRI]MCG7287103.1 primosomal protein N' [Cellulomonas sp. ACRRI]